MSEVIGAIKATKRSTAVDVTGIRNEAYGLFNGAATAAKKTLAELAALSYSEHPQPEKEQAVKRELDEQIAGALSKIGAWKRDISADLEARINSLTGAPGRTLESIMEGVYQVSLLGNIETDGHIAGAVWKWLSQCIENCDIPGIKASCDFLRATDAISLLSSERRAVVDRLIAAASPEQHNLRVARTQCAYTCAFLTVAEKALSLLAGNDEHGIHSLESEIQAEYEQPAPDVTPAESFSEVLSDASPELIEQREAARKRRLIEDEERRREAARNAPARNDSARVHWSGSNYRPEPGVFVNQREGVAGSLIKAAMENF
jgi:hypothetical protein